MRAWQVHTNGEPEEVLTLSDTPAPEPGQGQLQVRVLACALNFPDALLCRGEYQVKPPLPFTPGVEACAEITRLGDGVSQWQVGQRVIGTMSLPAGGLAEYGLMEGALAKTAPESLSVREASALYLGYQTGWFGLHRRARLQQGETLLVHAAAGGVGSAAVQLGKAAGATVIGVVGGPEKARVAGELGADVVVDRYQQDFVPVVKEATDGRGADVVYDPVGGEAFDRSTKCIAFEGRIVVVGFTSGSIPQARANHLLVKNYAVLGLHWGMYQGIDPGAVAAAHDELSRLADEGQVRPLIGGQFGMEQAAQAAARLAAGTTVGRLVVEIGAG